MWHSMGMESAAIILREKMSESASSSPKPVRYAEKRRKSTCLFADRVALEVVNHYRKYIAASFRESQKQTCLAAVVALVKDDDGSRDNDTPTKRSSSLSQNKDENEGPRSNGLLVLGMGVGTKFLAKEILQKEATKSRSEDNKTGGVNSLSMIYGSRVRDCHAEVLARRAFRRQLLLEILQDLRAHSLGANSILVRETGPDGSLKYKLRPGVSLHMYTSSAPCGNATVRR